MNITKLNQKGKCIFAIRLAERAAFYFNENTVSSLIQEAIEIAWKWENTEENIGEALYNFLDNEENGFTLLQEMEKDKKSISAWNCIIYSLAYVSKAAYEKEGVQYFPQPIEMVNDHIFDDMIQNLILCSIIEQQHIEEVYKMCLEKTIYLA